MKRKPVPAKLVMDCMRELNVVVAQMIDHPEHFTEAEIGFGAGIPVFMCS